MSPEEKLKRALATLEKNGYKDLTILNNESAKSLKKKIPGLGVVGIALVIVHCQRQGISIKIDDSLIKGYVTTFERELAEY